MQSVVTRDEAEQIESMPGPERNAAGKPYVSAELITLINVARDPTARSSERAGARDVPDGNRGAAAGQGDRGRGFDVGTDEAIVSRNLARRYANMKVGDTLKTGSFRWVIVGLFDAGGSAYESEMSTDASNLQQQTKRNMYSSVFGAASRFGRGEPVHRNTVKGDAAAQTRGQDGTQVAHDEQMITGDSIKALAFIVGFFTAIGAAFGAMNTM